MQRTRLLGVHGAFAPPIDTSRLGALDTLALAFLTDVGFKLGDRTKDAKDQLPHTGGFYLPLPVARTGCLPAWQIAGR